MNLGEQLDELRVNILHDKSDLVAGEPDFRWSDETLLRYIKDAERRFARDTLILRDGHSPQYCQITLLENVREYALHELVLAVLSARAAGQQSDLYRSGHALVAVPKTEEVLDFDTISNDDASTGAPQAVYTDETLVYASRGRVTLSVYPLPDADADGTVITARVVRLPKGEYTAQDLDRASEIPEDYQFDVLEWAAFRAQSGGDADSGSTTSATTHRDNFEAAVMKAKKELRRKIFVRTGLNYGQNGFSWER